MQSDIEVHHSHAKQQVFSFLRCFTMLLNTFWLQMLPWPQMAPRCSQMLPSAPRCSQDGLLRCQDDTERIYQDCAARITQPGLRSQDCATRIPQPEFQSKRCLGSRAGVMNSNNHAYNTNSTKYTEHRGRAELNLFDLTFRVGESRLTSLRTLT